MEEGRALAAAHGLMTGSVHQRVDELLTHHERRLELTWQRVRDGARTVYEVANGLRWTRRERALDTLDPFNRMLAVMETKAHLDVLAHRGPLDRTVDAGLWCYSVRARPGTPGRLSPHPR